MTSFSDCNPYHRRKVRQEQKTDIEIIKQEQQASKQKVEKSIGKSYNVNPNLLKLASFIFKIDDSVN